MVSVTFLVLGFFSAASSSSSSAADDGIRSIEQRAGQSRVGQGRGQSAVGRAALL
jgi:hypothetical protein